MYTFIKKENYWLAIDESRIETKLLADCQDRYGQKNGHVEAGSLLRIETQEAADSVFHYICHVLDEVPARPIMPGEWISASREITGADVYSDSDVFDRFLDHPGFELNSPTVDVVEYHDGHNWQTVYLSDADGLIMAEEIETDESVIRGLRACIGAFKSMRTEKRPGCDVWTGKKWRVTESHWQHFD